MFVSWDKYEVNVLTIPFYKMDSVLVFIINRLLDLSLGI